MYLQYYRCHSIYVRFKNIFSFQDHVFRRMCGIALQFISQRIEKKTREKYVRMFEMFEQYLIDLLLSNQSNAVKYVFTFFFNEQNITISIFAAEFCKENTRSIYIKAVSTLDDIVFAIRQISFF